MNIVNYTIGNELYGARRSHNASKGHLLTAAHAATNGISGFSAFVAGADAFTRRLPPILHEHEFNLTQSNLNKVFCAQWLDERRVMLGTKCNKVNRAASQSLQTLARL